MVWDGDYPWDVRVEKICKTLIENGHEAYLVCRNSKGLSRREVIDGINVRRIFALPPTFSRINYAITFPLFFSPFWTREIRAAVREISPDVVIIRDLPISLAAISATKPSRIPIILDMAECYPEMIRCAWKFEKFNLLNAVVRNPLLADLVESATLKSIDTAWVMVEESAARLERKGLPPHRIQVISNTPPNISQLNTPSQRANPLLKILYVGLINPSRGIETLIRAAAIVRSKSSDFHVKIAGNGKDFKRVSALIESLGLTEHITMTGWIKHDELLPLYQEADVGIVPHYKCSHWDNTIPNKIFDYMNAGIPVIVSNAVPTERIIKETQAGLTYESFDPHDLANAILKMQDLSLREKLSRNGQLAVQNRYNWSYDSKTLLASVTEHASRAKENQT